MRIVRVAAYRQLQPFRDGPYVCRGRSEDGTDSTIVVLESDDGPRGRGEMAPLGAFYAPAFAAGDARRSGRARAAAAGRRPARAGAACGARSTPRCSASRSSSRRSTWPSTTSRRRPPACRCARTSAGATARPSTSTAPSRRPRPTSMARERRRLRRRGLPAHPGQGRRRPGARTSSACTPCARPCRPTSCCSATPTAPGRPGRRARSCAPRAISRSRSSSRA